MKGKTRKEFFDELIEMQRRLEALEASEADRQREVTALRRQVERLQVVRDINEATLAERSQEAIAQLALDRMRSVVPYQRASIALFDFEARQARVLAARTEDAAAQAATTLALESLGPERIRALQKGKSFVENARSSQALGPQVVRALQAEGVPSCLSVPLAPGGALVGVINVWAPDCGDFEPEHIEVVHDVAAALALAIQQAGSREQLQRHARELVALYNAAQAMVSNLDLQSVLKTVITEAKTLLEAEAASVLLLSGNMLIFEAAVGPGSEALIGKRISIASGIVGWVMREKRPLRVNDAYRDPRFHASMDQLTGLVTRSVLAVPLVAKDIISGVIEVVNKVKPDGQSSIFYEQDLEILTAMAGPAAIAIENARLYQAKVKQFERLQSRLGKQ